MTDRTVATTTDNVKAVMKAVFAFVAAALFALPAFIAIRGALETPGFAPNEAQTLLLDMFGAAIIAFIAAQLGITVTKTGDTFRAKLADSMGSTVGMVILIIDVIIVLVVGFAFVVLWANPDMIKVAEGTDPLKEAPEYVATQAKLFLGLVVAASAAVGTSS